MLRVLPGNWHCSLLFLWLFLWCYVLCYAPASRPASSAVHIVIKGAPVSLAHRSMGSRIACCLCLSRGSGCPLRSSMGSGYAHLSLSSLYRFRLNIAQASGGYVLSGWHMALALQWCSPNCRGCFCKISSSDMTHVLHRHHCGLFTM